MSNSYPVGQKNISGHTAEQVGASQGTLEGEGGKRGVHLEPKPAGTLTFSDAPAKYLKLSVAHFFGRIADIFHNNADAVSRHAERTLTDPFASIKDKEAAVRSLMDLSDDKFVSAYCSRNYLPEVGHKEDPILRHLSETPALINLAVEYSTKVLTSNIPHAQAAYEANKGAIDAVVSGASEEGKYTIFGARTACTLLGGSAENPRRFDGEAFLALSYQDRLAAMNIFLGRDRVGEESPETDKVYQEHLVSMLEACKSLPQYEAMQYAMHILQHEAPSDPAIFDALFEIALSAENKGDRASDYLSILNRLGQRGDLGAQAAMRALKGSSLSDSEQRNLAEMISIAKNFSAPVGWELVNSGLLRPNSEWSLGRYLQQLEKRGA